MPSEGSTIGIDIIFVVLTFIAGFLAGRIYEMRNTIRIVREYTTFLKSLVTEVADVNKGFGVK